MRVITGAARGRRLLEPQGMAVRPTTDMVKEAMFNIIQFDIEGETMRLIMSTRSSMVNMGERLFAFTITSTTTRSKMREVRRTILRWPSVIGSKLPGQIAILIAQLSFL